MALLRAMGSRMLPLGLDFDGDVFVISELKFRSSGATPKYDAKRVVWRQLNREGFWLDEDKQVLLRHTLLEIVREHRWKGRKVVLSAPSEHLLLRHLSLPRMPKHSLKLAVETELRYSLQLPFDNPIYDYALATNAHVASRHEGEQDVVVLALPRDEVIRASDVVRSAGLRPVRMEPNLLAAERMLGSDQVRAGIYAILILREDGAELGVFDAGNLIFLRHVQGLPKGYEFQKEPLTDNGQILGYASDVSHEVERSLNFVQYNVLASGATIEHVYVFGTPSLMTITINLLQSRLDQIVRAVTPCLAIEASCVVDSQIELVENLETLGQKAVVSFGLALSEVSHAN